MLVGPEPISRREGRNQSQRVVRICPGGEDKGITVAGKREQGHRNGKGRQEWEFGLKNEKTRLPRQVRSQDGKVWNLKAFA